jgi:RNA polymerase sigma-70 factor (ECF subfamily)
MAQPHQEKTDEELMALHQAGDKDAFTTIYNRLKPDLCSFVARTLIGSWAADVEDVTDVIFLQLYESAERFEKGRRLIPYLYRIAEHCITDYVRFHAAHKRDSRRTKSLETLTHCCTGNFDDERIERIERIKRVERIKTSDTYRPRQNVQPKDHHFIVAEEVSYLLSRLPPKEAQVVKLICINGHTTKSAADTLGITPTQARWRYRQGWSRLQQMATDRVAQR